MPRHLHFDCHSGIAGDMFLGACLDLGLPLQALDEMVRTLALDGVTLEAPEDRRGGLRGRRFRVLRDGAPVDGEGAPKPDHHHDAGHGHGHEHGRPAAEIRGLLERSGLDAAVKELSLALLERLIEAESRVHGIEPAAVHFHELGALDSIVDLVGAALAMTYLAPDSVSCGPINVGGGTVGTAHGELPVPAPATAELLRGLPIYAAGELELVTPTGAALLAELVDDFGPQPAMVLDGIGYGLGSREIGARPNVFRLLSGVRGDAGELMVLECQVDDLSGEGLGFAVERLREGPARDVYLTPIQMKKGRPGSLVTLLVGRRDLDAVAREVMRLSGSLGCRWYPVERLEAERSVRSVETAYGAVGVKEGRVDGDLVVQAPEYEDCRRLALEEGVGWRQVYAAALRALDEE